MSTGWSSCFTAVIFRPNRAALPTVAFSSSCRGLPSALSTSMLRSQPKHLAAPASTSVTGVCSETSVRKQSICPSATTCMRQTGGILAHFEPSKDIHTSSPVGSVATSGTITQLYPGTSLPVAFSAPISNGGCATGSGADGGGGCCGAGCCRAIGCAPLAASPCSGEAGSASSTASVGSARAAALRASTGAAACVGADLDAACSEA
mmetsp:Transcript_90058/g.156053  ORF Transcript_90058/g.156053 Transcript_90058/m.156053 type:complete len:206 (+) Transcript_90058:211-828(+)